VDNQGIININQLNNLIKDETILITIMHSNNEVGSIQPIENISKILNDRNLNFHVDAAQSIGKVNIDVKLLNCDLCTIVGHKFGAPKGISVL